MNKRTQGIIPSYILKELAEKGNEHAIKSLAIKEEAHNKLSDNKKNRK
ncbi:hypothetical protein bthur0004_66100 [Bacillus thuringiensis serovar sotto str. T04001]|nr:hypothetical protein bthur0004_66100 [Bacillus thuringiensis serovar sotto str. T04001]